MTSPLEEFFIDMFGSDTEVVLGDSGIAIGFGEFLNLATAGFLDDVTPPKRNSPEYRETIVYVAQSDRLEDVASSLKGLYSDYGWRGVLDVMAEWVAQIENAPLTRSARYRDVTGTVELKTIIVIEATEEQRLRMAADKQQKIMKEEGLAPHLAFQQGLADTEAGIGLTERWYPYFRAALQAAHTTRDRRAVIAELFKSPFRDNPKEMVQGGLVLGTAAYGVRHQFEMAARFEEIAQGREAVHDPSVSPGWNGGGFMQRSALRRK